MKAKGSLLSYLFQPFRYFAGGWSLLAGVVFLLVLSVLSYFASTIMDGVLDLHFVSLNNRIPFLPFLYCIFLSWLSAVAVFYLTARILSKSSVRLVDMAGTMALAKKPMLFGVLLGFIPSLHQMADFGTDIQLIMSYLQNNLLLILLMSFVSLLSIIWYIILMYNAYSVSGNLKGNKGIISFIIVLFIAEIISKLLIMILV
ncbi:MAG: YIP1 family protein [Candidatus Symbiothrix sp.]|jgi:hypothetical protein|nr:YIP1 family protein [Candidatus Symbiothrix sp.]